MKNNKGRSRINSTVLLLAAVFLVLVFIPLIKMLSTITADNFNKVISSQVFGTALRNSIESTLIATLITTAAAYMAALAVTRCDIKAARIFEMFFVLPMLIPSISNGMGLIILFGNNGILTRIFSLSAGIYGIKGIVMGSVLYAFPVTFLMFRDVMQYEDASPYEAAEVLGIDSLHKFTAISFPYLRKPLISIVFSTFTLIVTDYGVPLMLGGKYVTLPVVLYQEVIGQLDFGKGAVYGCFLLVPAVIAFVLDLLNKTEGRSGAVKKAFEKKQGRASGILGFMMCLLISVYMLLPIISFAVLGFTADYPNDLSFTLQNVVKAISLRADTYLVNSIVIAVSTAAVGVCIAFATAYLTARSKLKSSRFLHLSAITSAAVPGVVLGLSYVLVFKGSFIYGSLAILVLVNMVHFMSSPYLMAYNSMGKINENLEAVGSTLAISRLLLIKDVIIPQCIGTIAEMFSYFFVNCMMTISAVSFLANTANKPVSLMINQFEAQMQLECAAIVSIAILAVNLIMKACVYFIKTGAAKKRKSIAQNPI